MVLELKISDNLTCSKPSILDENMEPAIIAVREDPLRWADLFVEDLDEGSAREQEVQVVVPNALVIAMDVGAKPLSILENGASDDEKSCFVKEKMLEIARILGIVVEGRIEELRACIRGMINEEFGCKKKK